jgi:carbon-monoxide dehydrogenase medium subunit
MKPAKFDFARAGSLSEAATILRQAAGTKVVAGGQSLGPMLNLHLVQPSILVDITAIPELTRFEEDADWVSVGACITAAGPTQPASARLHVTALRRAAAQALAA